MKKGKIKSSKKNKVSTSGNARMQAHREEENSKLPKTENRESELRRTEQDTGDLHEDNYRRRKSQ